MLGDPRHAIGDGCAARGQQLLGDAGIDPHAGNHQELEGLTDNPIQQSPVEDL
jgi:hypothetical protein